MPDEDDFYEQSAEELAAHYGPGGPVAAAFQWLELVLVAGDFRAAWERMDANLRLCRAQAWLWNNRTHPLFAPLDPLEQIAPLLVDGGPPALWDDFAAVELEQLQAAWMSKYERELGAASRPRPIGVDLEIVVLIPTDGTVTRFETTTLVDDALEFIVRNVEGRWLIAAYGDQLPEPGWPPSIV